MSQAKRATLRTIHSPSTSPRVFLYKVTRFQPQLIRAPVQTPPFQPRLPQSPRLHLPLVPHSCRCHVSGEAESSVQSPDCRNPPFTDHGTTASVTAAGAALVTDVDVATQSTAAVPPPRPSRTPCAWETVREGRGC